MLYTLCNNRTTPAFQAGLSPRPPLFLPSGLWVTTCLYERSRGLAVTSLSVHGLRVLTSPTVVADPSESNALAAGSSVLQLARLLCWRSNLTCILCSLVATLVMVQELAHGWVDSSSNARDSQLSVDIENGFNITRHRVIHDSLRLHYPSLIPFFRFEYKYPSSLRNNAGIVMILVLPWLRKRLQR